MPLLSRSLKNKQTTHFLLGAASYAAGGMSFDPKAEGAMLQDPSFVSVYAESVTYTAFYDHSNKKVIVRVAATGAQVANGTDLSAENFRILAVYP